MHMHKAWEIISKSRMGLHAGGGEGAGGCVRREAEGDVDDGHEGEAGDPRAPEGAARAKVDHHLRHDGASSRADEQA